MYERQEIRALAESARSGDPGAFDRLFSLNEGRFRTLISARLGSQLALDVDVDDVLQESALRAFRSIERFEWRGDGSFLRWLGGIAEHVIQELARKRARRHAVSLRGDVPADAVSPSRDMRRGERFDRLKKALEGLRPEHREVILLTRIEGLPFEDVARRMDRSPDAVKQLLYRALKNLRVSFGDTESLHLGDRRLEEGERG